MNWVFTAIGAITLILKRNTDGAEWAAWMAAAAVWFVGAAIIVRIDEIREKRS